MFAYMASATVLFMWASHADPVSRLDTVVAVICAAAVAMRSAIARRPLMCS
jgi:hypothetical protein